MEVTTDEEQLRLLKTGISVVRECYGTGDRIYVENLRFDLGAVGRLVDSKEAQVVGDRLTKMGLLTKYLLYLDHQGRTVATTPFHKPLDPKHEVEVIMADNDGWEDDDEHQMVEVGLLRQMVAYKKEPEIGAVIDVTEPEQLLSLTEGTYLVENTGLDLVGEAPVHRVVQLTWYSITRHETEFLAVVDGKNRIPVRSYFTFDDPDRCWGGLKFIKINPAAIFNRR